MKKKKIFSNYIIDKVYHLHSNDEEIKTYIITKENDYVQVFYEYNLYTYILGVDRTINKLTNKGYIPIDEFYRKYSENNLVFTNEVVKVKKKKNP